MKIAAMPFSADPITHGHVEMIRRSLEIADHVVAAIGTNADKVGKYLFKQEEREFLTKKVLSQFGDRVSVKSFSGLLTDFVYKNNIKTIIRGSRGLLDSAFEQMISDINRASNSGIETIMMFADQKMSHISSSAAKEIQKNFGTNILEYVPMIVKQALEEKLSHQFRIGVTGEIGAGKSEVTRKLQELRIIENIDLDQIGREILTKAKDPVYDSLREKLVNCFSHTGEGEIETSNGFIDIKKLTNLIFEVKGMRKLFDELMRDPMYLMLREKISALHGLIFINSALLVESNMLDFVNNNVILIKADKNIRIERLKKRGYSLREIDNRIHAQLDGDTKLCFIREKIQEAGHGKVVVYENNKNIDENDMADLLDQFEPSIFTKEEKND
jgi:pantetheine-phosphate adenylyltransferase